MRLFFASLLAFLLLAAGCSGGGNNPISPGQSDDYNPDAIPIIALSESGSSSNGLGILGPYEISVNPNEMTAELVLSREASLGESYLVNGLSYFTIAPCSDCLKISGIALTSDGNVEITFNLKHPFEMGDPSKPVTGKNRQDLDLFDVAMVIVPKNTLPTLYFGTNVLAYTGICEETDGYTRELENVIRSNAVYPYYLVVDDSKNEPGLSTFNRFPMGGNATFDIVLKPATTMNFNLYLTMGYGVSATKSTFFNPVYFNPEFNRKNAWKIQVIPPEGNNPPDPFNTWHNLDSTTLHTVTVKVWDWQQGVESIFDPPVEPTDIMSASDVISVSVEIPSMQSNIEVSTTPVSGTGSDPSDPLVYELSYRNANLRPAGVYTGLVKVTDQRVPPSTIVPGKSDLLYNVVNPINTSWVKIPEFVTYQSFPATVVLAPCIPATGSIVSPEGTSIDVSSFESIDFVLESTPLRGNIVYFWADWGTGEFTESSLTGSFLHQFEDEGCSDSLVPPTPVGDIALEVNREDMTSNNRFNAEKPLTLSWSHPDPQPADQTAEVRFGVELDCDPGNIQLIDSITIQTASCNDFVIYMDNDPDDGLTNNLVQVGNTIETSWDAPPSHLNIDGDFYVKGTTYVVFSRSSVGVESTTASQPAHVILTSGETSPPNVAYDYEGWITNNQSGNDSNPVYFPYVTQTHPASGLRSIRIGHNLGLSTVGAWEGIARTMPDVPGTSVRELELNAYKFRPS